MSYPTAQQLAGEMLNRARVHLFEESGPRIHRCVGRLSEEQLWRRPNERSNSVGNLVLHVAGNTYQWVVSSLGGRPDIRRRQAEFDERGPLPADELLGRLDGVFEEARGVLEEVGPVELMKTYPVQCFEHTGVAILMHVVEHTSYHAGQIAWITKATLGEDLAFYEGQELDRTN